MKALATISVLLFFFSIMALGASGNEEHHGGIPSVVWYQFLNVGILIVGAIWLLKSKVKIFFENRHNQFQQAMQRALSAKQEAEKTHDEVKDRLSKLEASAQESIEQAHTEAANMKERIIKEASEIASHVKDEADKAIQAELTKAKQELRMLILEESLKNAEEMIRKNISSNDQSRLQGEFIDQVKAGQ